jgi:hypothetical protein
LPGGEGEEVEEPEVDGEVVNVIDLLPISQEETKLNATINVGNIPARKRPMIKP